MLTDIIPAAWRAKVYAAYAIVTALLATGATIFAILQMPQPTWFTITGTIVIGLGTAFGLVAKANVLIPAPAAPADPQPVTPTSTSVIDGVTRVHYSDGTETSDSTLS